MALTYASPTSRVSIGARYLTVTQVTLDSSYPTGGYPFTPASLGLPGGALDAAICNTPPSGRSKHLSAASEARRRAPSSPASAHMSVMVKTLSARVRMA